MTRVRARLAAIAIGVGLSASPASALLVSWDVDPALSSFQLTIPDQSVTLGTITATMRLRNQNNGTWTQNKAPVDGFLATDITTTGVGIMTGVQFLTGAHSLVGVNTGNYRPNPASYNTAVTNATDSLGTFTNTTSDPAVFAARVNAFFIININTGDIAFDNVFYDLASAMLPVIGAGTSFASNTTSLGILDSRLGYDSIAGGTTGIGDALGQTGPISSVNSSGPAGSIVNTGGLNRRITIPINMPVQINFGGVILNATATGQVVANALIPEPATLGLMVMGIVGLAIHGRKRHS